MGEQVIWARPSYERASVHAFVQTGAKGSNRIYTSLCGSIVIHAPELLPIKEPFATKRCDKCMKKRIDGQRDAE